MKILGKFKNQDFFVKQAIVKNVQTKTELIEKRIRIFKLPLEKIELFKIYCSFYDFNSQLINRQILLPEIGYIKIDRELLKLDLITHELNIQEDFIIYELGLLDDNNYWIDNKIFDPVVVITHTKPFSAEYILQLKV